ncbi:hypothetical protein, partial [Streptococcus anginosus]|uniref:hypothetical protein n=1 Tax=Streptococcus anginosus TaxID=1328 RepID=UPI002EDBA0DC
MGVSLCLLVPEADLLTVSISWTIDPHSDLAKDETLHSRLLGQLSYLSLGSAKLLVLLETGRLS